MYKLIAAIIISLYFIFQLFLAILQYRNRNASIPKELEDVYDKETYIKWKKYSAEKIRLSIISEILNYVINLVLLMTNVFSIIVKNIENDYANSIIVLSIYLGINFIVIIIMSYFADLKLESKYGFNKMTLKTFILDQIKAGILMFALFIGIVSLFILLHKTMGDYIIILFTAILFVLSLLIAFVFPYLSKIFNKFVPLDDGELRDSLTKMLESHNYKVKDIKVMDASRRTTKSNAYFTGFGKTKIIVLYDNLLNKMSNEQIIAIFAHEMGHGIHKDTLKNSLSSILIMFIFVLLAWLLIKIPNLCNDFGFNKFNYGFASIILFVVLLPFVSTIIGFVTSYFSRRAEYRADLAAVKEGYGEQLIEALKILYREDLGDLNPHPLIVLLSYSHPTLLDRIKNIRNNKD
ncbi:MAG: M48 family metallopeptidase [Acholeplasmatales bacterium]|nr:M48 family metallopeptidase [Acholeplasmatales bacterium]